MIDPLRPYWPANRSLGGLLLRGLLLGAAALAVNFASDRRLVFTVIAATASASASFALLEWMHLRRQKWLARALALSVIVALGPIVIALVIDAVHVMHVSTR